LWYSLTDLIVPTAFRLPAAAAGGRRDLSSAASNCSLQRAGNQAAANWRGNTNLSGVTLTIFQLAGPAGRSAPRHDDPLALCGMEIILAVEIPTRPTADSAADSGPDPSDGERESKFPHDAITSASIATAKCVAPAQLQAETVALRPQHGSSMAGSRLILVVTPRILTVPIDSNTSRYGKNPCHAPTICE
jgi:hypothetical protein